MFTYFSTKTYIMGTQWDGSFEYPQHMFQLNNNSTFAVLEGMTLSFLFQKYSSPPILFLGLFRGYLTPDGWTETYSKIKQVFDHMATMRIANS